MTIGTGSDGNQFDQFTSPEGISVDGQGKIYVSDSWNNRVQVFDSSGAYLTTIGGSSGTNSAQFSVASSVADSRDSICQRWGIPASDFPPACIVEAGEHQWVWRASSRPTSRPFLVSYMSLK
jgi:DNA-binding beta-propeller fold protein YncE